MALEFRSAGFGFASGKGKTQEIVGRINFSKPVLKADVALQGFDLQFDNADHELHRITVRARVTKIELISAWVSVKILLRDHSGNIDDRYSGGVSVLVFAETGQLPHVPKLVFGSKSKAGAGSARKKKPVVKKKKRK
jgi:hypothetical protein